MTLSEIKDLMEGCVFRYAERFEALGLTVGKRTYFTDVRLTEYPERTPICDTMWCELTLGAPEMSEDDYLSYSLYVDLKRNADTAKSFEPKMISDFEAELDSLLEKLYGAENPAEILMRESEAANAEMEAALAEYRKKIKKMAITVSVATALVILGIFIVSLL